MMNLLTAAALAGSVAAGDDTPVGLYIVVGLIALALVIAAIVLGSVTKKDKKRSRKK